MRIIIISKSKLLSIHADDFPCSCTVLTHSSFLETLWGRYSYHVHFTDEDMEAIEASHYTRASQYINSRQSDPRTIRPLHHLSREKERSRENDHFSRKDVVWKDPGDITWAPWGGPWERALPVLGYSKIVSFLSIWRAFVSGHWEPYKWPAFLFWVGC